VRLFGVIVSCGDKTIIKFLKKILYCPFFMLCLSGDYVTEIVIQQFLILNHDASSLQEFSLELIDFVMFNVASYNNSGSSISFIISFIISALCDTMCIQGYGSSCCL